MNVQTIPIEQLLASETNPRSEADAKLLEELAASIRQDGILDPIRAVREGDFLRVESGHRRFAAAHIAGLTEVPVIVVEQSPADEAVRALVTNVQRENLNLVDEARAYQVLIAELGLTSIGVAERVGVSPTRVTQRLELLELPEQIIDLYRSGKLSPTTRIVLKQMAAVSPKLATTVARVTASNGWDVALVKNPDSVLNQVERDKDGVFRVPGQYRWHSEDWKLSKDAQTSIEDFVKGKPKNYMESLSWIHFTSDDADAAVAAGVAIKVKGQDHVYVDDKAWLESQLQVVIARHIDRCESVASNRAKEDKKQAAAKKGGATAEDLEALKVKARNKVQRDAVREAREVAHAENLDLGRALMTDIAAIDVGAMPVPLATAISRAMVGERAGAMWLAGLRYCLPQGFTESRPEGKPVVREFTANQEDGAKLMQSWLDGASKPSEIIGRSVAAVLAVMYSDENVVVKSSQRGKTCLPSGDYQASFVSAMSVFGKVIVDKKFVASTRASEKHVIKALAAHDKESS